MSQYPAVIALSSLDGTNGFKINGETTYDRAGFSVSSAGDINGDGIADIIIGARDSSAHASDAGASYVVFGSTSGFGTTFELSSLDGNNGFQINGETAGDRSGFSVSSAGDVNGDGFGDVIIGAPGPPFGSDHGFAYVVFGKASGFDPTLELSSLDGDNGFQVNGEGDGDYCGFSVSSAGDVNGDGFDDVIVGASHSSLYGTYAGLSYVVFGKASGFDATLEPGSLDGSDGFRIYGAPPGGQIGLSVSSAGDVNGDGFDDLIAGRSGVSYVIFGKASPFYSLLSVTSLDGANGFAIDAGTDVGAYSWSVSSAGDVNGDGFADIIVGTPHGNGNTGAAYVVFGARSDFSATVELSDLDGANGFQINGETVYDVAGWSVSSAGDFNGDGFDDLIVGAYGADPNGSYSGEAYVVFGRASGFDPELNLSSLDGNNGFQLKGAGIGDNSGQSVSAAGDVNGDGFDDLIVGAPDANPHGNDSGISYVIFGSMPGEAVVRIGTDIANTIHGGNFDDTLRGLAGRDTLYGHDGNDTLRAGQGSDTLIGGAGNDTLTGRTGGDFLSGGAGADTFFYDSAADSTGRASNIDIVKGADFTTDAFDIPTGITGIDASIGSGVLRKGHFDTDMAAAADGAHLGANHAVLFAPDSGSESGKIFLLVDVNGVAGYQTGEDLAIQLSHSVHLASLGIEDFI